MIYTVSKKLLIITSIITVLFLFGCNKSPQIKDIIVTDTGEAVQQNIEIITGDTENQSGDQNNFTGTKIDTLLTDTGDIKTLIDQYKISNTGNSDKLNENDIDLMEKVIDKIDKK